MLPSVPTPPLQKPYWHPGLQQRVHVHVASGTAARSGISSRGPSVQVCRYRASIPRSCLRGTPMPPAGTSTAPISQTGRAAAGQLCDPPQAPGDGAALTPSNPTPGLASGEADRHRFWYMYGELYTDRNVLRIFKCRKAHLC